MPTLIDMCLPYMADFFFHQDPCIIPWKKSQKNLTLFKERDNHNLVGRGNNPLVILSGTNMIVAADMQLCSAVPSDSRKTLTFTRSPFP